MSNPLDASAAGQEIPLNHAVEYLKTGNPERAEAALIGLVALDPLHAQAHHLLSLIAIRKGDLEYALGRAREAARLAPGNADFHLGLARVYVLRGRMAEAIHGYREAVRLRPDVQEWRLEFAAALVRTGRLDEAVAAYETGPPRPPDARAYFDLGHALLQSRQPSEAEQALLQAAVLAPESGGIQFYLALACREQDRPLDAEKAARRAVAVAPDMPQGWFALGSALTRRTKHVEAVEHFREAISLLPEYEAARDGLLCTMNYSEHWSSREIYDAHMEWGRRFPRPESMPVPPSSRATRHRPRVGYLSPDFRQHPVSHFIEPILRSHKRDRFEIFCYHSDVREDSVTTRLEGWVENWRPVGDASDAELENVLREDSLDILVELSGHTDGHRLAVLARRVAPIQITYLGYPNTTGLAAIDYRLTDRRADPPGESDYLHSEKLVRLPKAFLCYLPPETRGDSRIPPFRRNGNITFCSFNNLRKISPTCITLWARVLSRVPNSKLLIKTFGLQEPGLRTWLLEQFKQAGAGRDQVAFAVPTRDHNDHMQTYGEADIALDTFPYNGTTTTLDALWMGVPVITLAGDRHASRVGLSILSAVDLTELATRTPDEYVAAAAELAINTRKLEQLRSGLRERLASSPLTDGSAFTADLENVYWELLKR
jgi:protein O-GlcNAc transferase